MKKLIICSILIIILFNVNVKSETTNVFKENSYSIYELDFPNKTLSTKNFDKLNNVTVISITPFVNKLYEDKLNYIYTFELFSNSVNIDRFTNDYINILEDRGYKGDAISSRIDGIFIKNMVVYCSLEEINYLKNELKFNYIEIK